ncbi:hypothetical protein MAIT1_01078 [Magnetofaba australis IT-1]|uniref:Uncharacterized protein n=2 Tax=Magnetofaba TaxID=1472292 RepID=A0A1Y2K9U5_9PROT|nr:hypothetical protein MAIT1_01078 [Magnetofaba australis IT-1]
MQVMIAPKLRFESVLINEIVRVILISYPVYGLFSIRHHIHKFWTKLLYTIGMTTLFPFIFISVIYTYVSAGHRILLRYTPYNMAITEPLDELRVGDHFIQAQRQSFSAFDSADVLIIHEVAVLPFVYWNLGTVTVAKAHNAKLFRNTNEVEAQVFLTQCPQDVPNCSRTLTIPLPNSL